MHGLQERFASAIRIAREIADAIRSCINMGSTFENQWLSALPAGVMALPALHAVVPDGAECMDRALT